jgi:DNA-binding FadR family transcriptional regulator
MAHLSELGLVKTLAQSGTYVTDYQTEGSLDLLVHIMKTTEVIDSGVLLSLLRFRRITAPFYASQAALMAGPDDIEEFRIAGEALIKSLGRKGKGTAKISESDFRFHSLIARMTKDLVFQLFFNSFKPIYRYYTDIYYNLPDSAQATIAFVNDLTAAISSKDPDNAARIMDDAVIDAEKRLLTALDLKAGKRTIPLKTP